jgi:type IV pilus assembly protein PilN
MRQINLLPWREAKRKQRQREFGIMALASLVVAGVIVGAVHLFFDNRIEYQTARNDYLKEEIQKQKRVEKEIKVMEATKARILGRMEVIQNLQASRPEMVHVFDEMVRVLPEEVYLTRVQRSGEALSLVGVARSNNLVSDFMRNLRDSGWFGDPSLQIINNKEVLGIRASFFEMKVAKKKLTAKAGDRTS